jgi:hypothetical protein
MKLSHLFEVEWGNRPPKTKNLIGLKIDCQHDTDGTTFERLITDKTPQESWFGDFICTRKDLRSLKGAPKTVSEQFHCYNNKLTTLEDGPTEVGTNFECDNNKLTSLKGAPSKIGGHFMGFNNRLTSLEGIHKIIKEVNGRLDFSNNRIKSHVLGVLLIKGVTEVDFGNSKTNPLVDSILNRRLPNTTGNKAVLDCQSEMLDAGLDEYAQL